MAAISTVYNASVNYQTGAHAHGEFMLLIPERGILGFTDEITGREMILSERQFLLAPPHRVHSSAAQSASQCHTALYIQPDYLQSSLSEVGTQLITTWRFSTPRAWQASPLLLQLLAAQRTLRELPHSNINRLQSSKLGQLIMLECVSLAAHQPVTYYSSDETHGTLLIRDICIWLGHNLQLAHSLDKIADTFHISRRHLTRLFRAHTGVSINDWLQQQRIELAANLLKDTDLSITDIASHVGFESPSHFASIFRQHHSQPPFLWRKQHRRQR